MPHIPIGSYLTKHFIIPAGNVTLFPSGRVKTTHTLLEGTKGKGKITDCRRTEQRANENKK
jgi:hypothetical protein